MGVFRSIKHLVEKPQRILIIRNCQLCYFKAVFRFG